MKPGWKTTEFWVNALVTGYTIFVSTLPPDKATMVIAASNGLYMLCRTVVKVGDEIKAKKRT
jgi:hypothetical protein